MKDRIRRFGLIGYPVSHSFSQQYFTRKFEREGLSDHRYELFSIKTVAELPALLERYPDLCGLNVTLPHKQSVISLLDELSPEAREIGAVNVIRIRGGKRKGFNTDAYGFERSLVEWAPLPSIQTKTALVLGTGGASRAVDYVLRKLDVPFLSVSRDPARGDLVYGELADLDWGNIGLIVNTTPLGMYPEVGACPDLPYASLTPRHYLFDLVYNPEKTLFLKRGEARGSHTQNGLKMLYQQAERAWEIWRAEA